MSSQDPHFENDLGKDVSQQDLKYFEDLYCSQINIPPKNNNKQEMICPVGCVGAGKSTVMKPLSERLGFVRISTDEIRLLLSKYGYNHIQTKQIAFSLIVKFIQQGYSIIIDADCISFKKELEKLGYDMNIHILWVHINPTEEFILDKLRGINYTWGLFKDTDDAITNYYRRKPLHENVINRFNFIYTFDTSSPDLNNQINLFINRLNKKILLNRSIF